MQLLTYTNGVYRTKPNKVSWWAKTLPTVTFYRRFLTNIVRSSNMAKRGMYDGAQWSQSSLEVLQSLESVGVQFEITGVDHLQQLTTPFLVIVNHWVFL
jgi:1-acyl-sn-glycerol-3-phosphate acyltransferase